ncbi:hypothetical protein GE118_03135 [Mycoplasma sp. NEAQ87857]|uniref:hypothetical protein n=1 Tax=Mycoplasma sp. NEAQ87857 TaxID=2683967 RepID=UPI0013178813|nr:hypothetical protein [Mycoplasma sp. NEAQ87857]QGZ97784.1 hypothetical protein GE118_03135 [Mycoplasma sp. NEAQ87857]
MKIYKADFKDNNILTSATKKKQFFIVEYNYNWYFKLTWHIPFRFYLYVKDNTLYILREISTTNNKYFNTSYLHTSWLIDTPAYIALYNPKDYKRFVEREIKDKKLYTFNETKLIPIDNIPENLKVVIEDIGIKDGVITKIGDQTFESFVGEDNTNK